MNNCAMELCPNWAGDGDGCPCAVLGLPKPDAGDPDPPLDEVDWDELDEVDPKARVVADVLEKWGQARCCLRHHMVGTFLDLLAAEGYRVEPIQAPAFEDVLPVEQGGGNPQ